MSAEVAGAFYYYYAAAGWRLSRGKPITKGNLRHALMLWDIRQRELERRHGGRVSSHGNHTVTTRRGDVVAGVVLTMDEYYQRFGTTEVQEGWRMENPTGEKMVYVKI